MNERKNLVRRLYDSVRPEVKIDEQNKTFEITREGLFFNNATETYYILRGYRMIDSSEQIRTY